MVRLNEPSILFRVMLVGTFHPYLFSSSSSRLQEVDQLIAVLSSPSFGSACFYAQLLIVCPQLSNSKSQRSLLVFRFRPRSRGIVVFVSLLLHLLKYISETAHRLGGIDFYSECLLIICWSSLARWPGMVHIIGDHCDFHVQRVSRAATCFRVSVSDNFTKAMIRPFLTS